MILGTAIAYAVDTEYYWGRFTFPTGGDNYPVCYKYAPSTADWAATVGEVDEPLVKDEIFRVCLVRDKRANVSWDTEPAVTIDVAGQLVLGENAIAAKWMTLRWSVVGESAPIIAEYITVGDALGVPSNKVSVVGSTVNYGFDVFTSEDVEGSGGRVYAYLVAMDTRTGEGACEGKPYHVKAYAMALCYGAQDRTYLSTNDATGYSWLIGRESPTDIIVYCPGVEQSWRSASAIESLVVTQDGAQVTLTGDALAAYLKPSVNSLTQGIEGGKSVLNLAVTAPDVQYYTLYTKAKLSDTEWTKFEDYLKTLDNVDGKYYTRFRIDGESPLKIPVLTDETSRFYQLRGE